MRGCCDQTAKITLVTPTELALCPHPSQHSNVPAPRVTLSAHAHGLSLVFALPDVRGLALPASGLRGAADGLWQHTCFECFVGVTGERAYAEFNASPSLPEGQWAHYRFSDERQRDPQPSTTASASVSEGPPPPSRKTACISSGLRARSWRAACRTPRAIPWP